MARENELNLDPISKEPGAHPVGTGLGAVAGGAAAGAAAGVVGGPIVALAGGVVAGGLGCKAAAEAVNPTAEEAFWRDNYDREPYYQAGRSYDDYAPAYRMGVGGYNQRSGSYEDNEQHLANQWDSNRGSSTLGWPEASAASRAAWSRAGGSRKAASNDTGMSQGMGVGGGSQSMQGGGMQQSSRATGGAHNDDVVNLLNDLLEISRDGEFGFRESAEHAKSLDIKTLLSRRAEDCHSAATELQVLVKQCGGEPEEGGTAGGAMHRGWVSLRGNLTGFSDLAMLEECERGEDVALAKYRKVLKQRLPSDVKTVVERQAQGAQRNHDQIKVLRDSLRAAVA